MKHSVGRDLRDCLEHRLPIDDVDPQQLRTLGDPALLPRGEVVDHGHPPALRQQGVY